MRKATRLFEIVEILRAARGPTTAATLAARLEVVPRSIYRDIAALQAMRVPIEGERGVGYILRPGFLMPPLMFSIEECEAIVVALGLFDLRADPAARLAAEQVKAKIVGAVPPPLRRPFERGSLFAWGASAAPPIDVSHIRHAIRDEVKLGLRYRDEQDRLSERTILPIALIYYPNSVNLVAWCELRADIRTFRVDRIVEAKVLPDRFAGRGDQLRQIWVSRWPKDASRSA